MAKIYMKDLIEGASVRYKHIGTAEGVLHNEGNKWYFLTNSSDYDGSRAVDLMGYKYSYWFGSKFKEDRDKEVIGMEFFGGVSTSSTSDDDIRGDAVTRNKKIDTLLILGI